MPDRPIRACSHKIAEPAVPSHLLLLLLTLLSAACGSARGRDVIFLPSAADVVTRMLAVARVHPDDVVYDLGCGDGRIVIAAARDHGARGVCVDIDRARIEASQSNADTAGVRDLIEFRHGDLFHTDLATATVVALYLSPALNERLRPKLLRELRPGARIISHNFPMGDWKPDTVIHVARPAGTTSSIHAWIVPADVAGNWALTVTTAAGDRPFRVRFAQHYQELSGTASAEGLPVTVSAVRLRGDSLGFRFIEERGGRPVSVRLTGQILGAAMHGVTQSDTDSTAGVWRAARP